MNDKTFNNNVRITDEIITNIWKSYKFNNAEICLWGKCLVNDLIETIKGNRIYIPAFYFIIK